MGNRILFIDGLTRTGKSLMGPICSSFEYVEIERIEEYVECLGALYYLGKITQDAAVAYLQHKTDMCIYDSMLSRNINFRVTDHSSVWRSSKILTYMRRLLAKEGDVAVSKISEKKVIFQNMTHDQLMNFNLFHVAFQDRVLVIELFRHPVNLIDSWLRRGWGMRLGRDPRAFTFTLDFHGTDVPYYAFGWEEEYLDSSPTSRVLKMINVLWKAGMETLNKLSERQKKQILFIPFEGFIQNPFPYLSEIEKFLQTKRTKSTGKALSRERCPREYRHEDVHKRKARIINDLPKEESIILEQLSEKYERMYIDSSPES